MQSVVSGSSFERSSHEGWHHTVRAAFCCFRPCTCICSSQRMASQLGRAPLNARRTLYRFIRPGLARCSFSWLLDQCDHYCRNGSTVSQAPILGGTSAVDRCRSMGKRRDQPDRLTPAGARRIAVCADCMAGGMCDSTIRTDSDQGSLELAHRNCCTLRLSAIPTRNAGLSARSPGVGRCAWIAIRSRTGCWYSAGSRPCPLTISGCNRAHTR